MKNLRLAFVGYGAFAQVRERYLKNYPNTSLVGFYDPHQHDNKHIRKYNDLDTMLTECDAVIVSVPPKLAPGYVCRALASKKHVFCEKPAAVNTKDLESIEKFMRHDLVLAYGFNHRQHPSIAKMRDLLVREELGKIIWLRGRYGKEVDQNYVKTWRCNKELNGGGILIDQGIHLVDLMSYLTGGFDGAQAVLSNHYLNLEGVDDNCFITLYSTNSKISASLHSTITQWRYLFSLEVFMERGSMVLNGLRTNSGRYGEEILTIKPNSAHEPDMGSTEISYKENVSWRKEIGAFVDSAANGNPYPFAGYDDALKTTKLIDLIYQNAVWL